MAMNLFDKLVSENESPLKVYNKIRKHANELATNLNSLLALLVVNNKGQVIFPMFILPKLSLIDEKFKDRLFLSIDIYSWLVIGTNLGSKFSKSSETNENWLIDSLIDINEPLIFSDRKDATFKPKESSNPRDIYYRWKRFKPNTTIADYFSEENFELKPKTVKIELPVIGGLGIMDKIKDLFIGDIAIYPKPDGKDNLYSIKFIAPNIDIDASKSKSDLTDSQLNEIYSFMADNLEIDYLSFLLSHNIRSQNSGSNSDYIIRFFKMEFGREILDEILKKKEFYEDPFFNDFICRHIFCMKDFLISRYLIRSVSKDNIYKFNRIYKNFKSSQFKLKSPESKNVALIPNEWTEFLLTVIMKENKIGKKNTN
jgi:hypothetical protein